MYPATTHNGLQNYQAKGLNGWFGKFIKGLITTAIEAVKLLPFGKLISQELTAIVKDWTNNYEHPWWSKTAAVMDYEPTKAEQVILSAWSQNSMIPYYTAMVSQLSSVVTGTDFTAQITQINIAMQKICVIKKYFATRETTGLSVDAVKARMVLINEIFLPIESIITTTLAKYPLVITKSKYGISVTASNAQQFQPLISTLTIGEVIPCEQYQVSDQANTNPGAVQLQPVNPVKPVKGEILPVVAGDPLVAEPTQNAKKPNYLLWIIGAFAAYKLVK